MVVTKTDISTNKPTTSQLIQVANGEDVIAETENANNLLMLQALILAYNWIIDSGVEISGTNIFTALQQFSAGIKTGQIDPLNPNGDIILNTGTGSVYKNTVTALNKYLTSQEITALVAGASGITDGDKGDITISSGATQFTIDTGAVTDTKLATGAVTDTKLATGAVTDTKLASGAVTDTKLASNSVTTAKITNANVTQEKLGFTVVTRTTTANAAVNEYILADTSSTAWTLTFPASANAGDKIFVVDLKNTFDTKNLTIARNGLNIENQSTDLVCDLKGFIAMFYYVNATIGWKRI